MKAAIYCRLSKEDEELEKDGSGRESESIQNQKSMLIHYAVEKGYDIYQIYCDEDYSGVDRARPAFNRMIDLPLTKQVVSRVVKLEKKQVSVESIQDVVCKYYNLELAVIQTNSRKREIVQARQVTMYLAKKYTDSSFSHIGKIVGKRDHATVLHACKTVRDQIETNKSFRSSVEEIEALLKA